jgi:outer membrane lipoprotein SlyB
MNRLSGFHQAAAAFTAGLLMVLAGCAAPPPFQVTEAPVARIGRVESITQDTVQNVNNAVGAVGGAVVGGALGSLVGGGRGQTLATVVGATGGAVVGNQAAQNSQTLVWRIGVRYDDGTTAMIQQTSAPNLRVGDRVRVTSTGIELLR